MIRCEVSNREKKYWSNEQNDEDELDKVDDLYEVDEHSFTGVK